MELNEQPTYYKTPTLGRYGSFCAYQAIERMLETGKIISIVKSDERSSDPQDTQLKYGVYLALLEFFPPLIMYWHNAIYPKQTDISFDLFAIGALAERCRDIIGLVNKHVRVCGKQTETKKGQVNQHVKALIAWCAKAHAILEHLPPEKRFGNENLTEQQKQFLPELKRFFEIFFKQEEALESPLSPNYRNRFPFPFPFPDAHEF
ncbi:MAG: hypothetical protein HYT28_03530 [Parcubacteria group bacterium]|nr:hypothetical protein [Parcubacteria group bacterium]